MRLKTILNQCLNFKSFCIGNSKFDESKKKIFVEIHPRSNSQPISSCCQSPAPRYDVLPVRLFEFIPFWGFQVFLIYAMRRVSCPVCHRVVVEQVPWCSGKHHLTIYYAKYLADWAKETSWKRVAERFRTSWQTVCSAVEWVVEYGLRHRCIDNITAIGIDEVAWKCGHQYLTLVYQIDQGCRRLLWIGLHRTGLTLRRFFAEFKTAKSSFGAELKVVCTDMWRPFLDVIRLQAPDAMNVLDRFHIMQKFNKAIDQIRVEEAKRLKSEKQDPVLAKSRWCFLKRSENLTEKQSFKLQPLLKMNLRTVRAYLLKEQFQKFWEYKSPIWAGKFLDQWCHAASRSRIGPMQDVARMLQDHRELVLNYFRAKKQFNSGIVEGLNRKVNLTIRKAFGFRSLKCAQTCLYHQLGDLPEPEFTHEFW